MIKIEKKRLRGPNFTNSDNLLLCKMVAKYKHIIENKKIDGENLQQKRKAWLAVEKEFNSIATGHYRTVESLQHNYKNLKKKAKKKNADAKMDIPVDRIVLLENIEESGTSSEGWEKVSEGTGASEDHCKKEFEALRKETVTKDNCFKKKILGTGGGPPPRSDDDPLLDKVKALVGPSFDGLQSSLATEKSELVALPEELLECQLLEEEEKLQHNQLLQTMELEDAKKRYATEKLELVAFQKELLKCQLLDEKEKLQHNRLLRAMELEDAKKRHEHNELIRQLQLQSFNK